VFADFSEFLEGELRDTGSSSFRQEYLCEFLEDGRQMFGGTGQGALQDAEVLGI